MFILFEFRIHKLLSDSFFTNLKANFKALASMKERVPSFTALDLYLNGCIHQTGRE